MKHAVVVVVLVASCAAAPASADVWPGSCFEDRRGPPGSAPPAAPDAGPPVSGTLAPIVLGIALLRRRIAGAAKDR